MLFLILGLGGLNRAVFFEIGPRQSCLRLDKLSMIEMNGRVTRRRNAMLRRTLIALAAVVALGASSTAMAKGAGSGVGAHVSSGGAGLRSGGGSSIQSFSATGTGLHRFSGPMHMHTRIGTLGPRTAWSGPWHHGGPWHHRHHRHDRDFFAFGLAGPVFYDYGYYGSCWRWAPTYWGWRRVWACDYPWY
jgi:hypothetical protein